MPRMGRRMEHSIFVNSASTLSGPSLNEKYASMSIDTPTGDGIAKPSRLVRQLHCCLVDYFRIT